MKRKLASILILMVFINPMSTNAFLIEYFTDKTLTQGFTYWSHDDGVQVGVPGEISSVFSGDCTGYFEQDTSNIGEAYVSIIRLYFRAFTGNCGGEGSVTIRVFYTNSDPSDHQSPVYEDNNWHFFAIDS